MGSRPHRRPWLPALTSGLALTASLVVTASVVLAAPAWAQDPRAFAILKRLEQQKLSEALELVRASQRCVEAARNLRALHDCHRQEREREWEQRERFRSQIEAVRSRHGLRRPREEPPPGPF